ncbi:MAG: ATP-binding cassette domain-containing protein [Myxococcota bacterium]
MIEVEGLTKVYKVPLKDPGLMGSIRSLWNRKHTEVRAVDNVSFTVAPGERVGFLGPNGAGKTTTLKVLTGLLHPTAGRVQVAGFTPQKRNPTFLSSVTLVMGQKQQLLWDVPATESFLLNRAVYDLDRTQYEATVAELTELLSLSDILDRPVRNLSLGQRMRCEIAVALLHRPKVLFLDEPTIGLDVEVQTQVRRFVREYNERHDATIMLTSHDMDDVSAIADRILLIDKGQVRFDGPLTTFRQTFAPGRRVRVSLPAAQLASLDFTTDEHGQAQRDVAADDVNPLLQAVLAKWPQANVTVQDPPLEEVLSAAFAKPDAP